MRIFLMIVEVLVCLGLIAAVLMQSSRSAGVSGAIGGAADQFFGKKKGLDEFLAKIAAGLTVGFFVIALILAIFLG